MSKDIYTFDDLEDILAEFSDKGKTNAEPVKAAAPKAVEIPAEPVVERPRPVTEKPEAAPAAKAEPTKPAPAARPERKIEKAPQPKKPEAAVKKSPGSSFAEFEALFSRDSIKKDAAKMRESMPKSDRKNDVSEMRKSLERKGSPMAHSKPSKAPSQPSQELKSTMSKVEEKAARKEARAKQKAEERARLQAEAQAKKEAPAPQPIQAEEEPRKKFSAIHSLLSLVFAGLSLVVLAWVLFNVHPASGSSVITDTTGAVLKLTDKLDVYMNNMASDALGELAYIKKIYTLQESDTVAPVPNPDGFGTTRDVAVIQDVIKKAAPLLEGQSVSFDPNADFVPDTDFMYYLDDTIMVIAWKEYINERCCTMAEVKIAHGSQLRRKLAEDSYSSSVQYYASDMANASNAVIAINGDFYAFRDLGITVYQRQLYRNNPASVDSCFFTASGDMLFSRAGELMGEGETQKFIEDNDVVFAIAFGPVLVDNGELQYCASYPIGEINTEYSRSCIGMTDELHYLLMTINHTPDARPRATINDLARYIYSKGVQKAYTLDGGQTAEIVMMGGPINHVDFGAERTVSDIIYFATAIPNEEVN